MASLKATDLFCCKGLVCVVTGGGSGLGKIMAETLAANGAAKVYIIGRRKEKLEEVAKSGPAGVIIPLQADITSKPSLSAAAAQIKSEAGQINILIANSGIMGPRLSLPENPSVADVASAMWSADPSAFNSTLDTNVTGVYFTIAAFLELLDAGNRSSKAAADSAGDESLRYPSQVVVTTSVAGFSRQAMAGLAYPVSKAAANHLVKLCSTLLIPFDVRVNGIAPGMYRTDMLPDVGTTYGSVDRARIPLTKAATEVDMANVVLSLCSRSGTYHNGFIHVTDGGRLSGIPSVY